MVHSKDRRQPVSRLSLARLDRSTLGVFDCSAGDAFVRDLTLCTGASGRRGTNSHRFRHIATMAPLLPGVHLGSSSAHTPVIADCDPGLCMERAPLSQRRKKSHTPESGESRTSRRGKETFGLDHTAPPHHGRTASRHGPHPRRSGRCRSRRRGGFGVRDLERTHHECQWNAPHGPCWLPHLPGDLAPDLSKRVVLHDLIADHNTRVRADSLHSRNGPQRRHHVLRAHHRRRHQRQ